MGGRFNKIILAILLATVSYLYSADYLKILVLRVDFQEDYSISTTGTGKFLLQNNTLVCNNYTVDPPPHDKPYFESQLKALDSYYRSVSNDNFGIDLNNSKIFPTELNSSYTLPDSMSHYHPALLDLSDEDRAEKHEELLVELFSDAVNTAFLINHINFSQYDLVVVFHAGVGQDFDLGIEDAIEDIPSTFIDSEMIARHLGNDGLLIENTLIKYGIILPETQNHILYPEMVDYFKNSGVNSVCNYQYGLTGTFALYVGQAIGLPPLWNTETGASGIGDFGLMDHGSNNGQGLIPAPPSAWNRIFAGWEVAKNIVPDEIVDVVSRPTGEIIKVDIDNDEYYLIENRTNWIRSTVDIDSVKREVFGRIDTVQNTIEIIFDSIGVEIDENGVVVSVPDYDLGLPGSGLLIWHIDESIINYNYQSYSINNNSKTKGIDLEEAGGPQDIGYVSSAIFRDPSTGEIYDMWYQGNPEYDQINSNTQMNPLVFNSFTFPNTNSNNGALTNLYISGIGFPADTMQISITNDLMLSGFPDTSLHIKYHTDFNGDGKSELIGGEKELWWSETDKIDKKVFYELPSSENHIVLTNSIDGKEIAILSNIADSLKLVWFKYEEKHNYSGFVFDRETIFCDGWCSWDSIQFLDGHNGLNSGHSNHVIFFSENRPNITYRRAWFDKISGIAIDDQLLAFTETKFIYISAIDLDINGKIEILAVDDNGKLYAINQNYTFASGFPVDYNAVPPILSKNIMGDEKPEIIFKNKTGDIIILNNNGIIQHRLSGNTDSKLIMLGEHNGRNTIVSESSIWIFDEVSDNVGNEWTSWYGNEMNSTLLAINYGSSNNPNSKLFEKDKTYVYPNPARDNQTTFRLHNNSATKIEIKIYDSAGYFVHEINSEINASNSVWETEWDVSNIESGIYLCNLIVSDNNDSDSIILKVAVIH